ncbi:hypothetical protein [Candidatus Endoriftia persephonae]|jgi:hypothetical protein|uniref:Uncharacterized protein n=2 Tax=Gammaproteobacteria TaxID=1236 RepID=G2FHF1_9GAMM|nr:hypothetical protein [Candidatus Endoriftia persephone]EGW53825.1 hypothetical protein TevJSym_au00610 [endosymbiont of Tevnia jerichonana (vent Tica)]USF88534.1 hypothetical protein L0Y14_04675 [Candidatus Endoriftia persephone]
MSEEREEMENSSGDAINKAVPKEAINMTVKPVSESTRGEKKRIQESVFGSTDS